MIKVPWRAKIQLIKLRSIGDVVYNTVVYTPLKRIFPGCTPNCSGGETVIWSGLLAPDIDKVLCFEKEIVVGQIKFYFVFGKFDG